MRKLVFSIIAFVSFTYIVQAQQASSSVAKAVEKEKDLTGVWEGEFILGTLGLRQPHKMVLEVVHVEGKMHCIVDLYPIDTKENDKPNITYTFEGKTKPETVIYSLIQGRVVHGVSRYDVVQLLFNLKTSDDTDVLAGRWFRQLEPVNSRERGSGTFKLTRTGARVSDRLLLPRQEKEILEKLEKQQQPNDDAE